MNTPTTFSLFSTSFRHHVLTWLLGLFLSATGQAADLTFTPAEPVVEVGKQITLSVSGTIGEVIWSAQQGGWFDPPTGTQVTYNAPSNPKKLEDVVTVSDDAGNVAILKIKLTTLPLENLNWEIFTDPGTIKDMVLSQDGKTLWVVTGDSTGCGGKDREPSIEQRDANAGKLKRRFTTSTSSDGFPKSECPYLLLGANDEQLWLGTCDQRLAYYDSYTGKWTVYNKDSGLPDNQITNLLSDGNGGLWVNTPNGLAYRNNNKQWKIFNTENSNLPSNDIIALWLDKNEGGLWIETTGPKLTYLNPVTEELMVYNTDNTGVKFNLIQGVVSDDHGGLWMQIIEYSESETEEECYDVEHYNPCDGGNNYMEEVCDPISFSQEKGIAHLSKNGKWDLFTTANSKLPGDNIQSMVSDQAGGVVDMDGFRVGAFEALECFL